MVTIRKVKKMKRIGKFIYEKPFMLVVIVWFITFTVVVILQGVSTFYKPSEEIYALNDPVPDGFVFAKTKVEGNPFPVRHREHFLKFAALPDTKNYVFIGVENNGTKCIVYYSKGIDTTGTRATFIYKERLSFKPLSFRDFCTNRQPYQLDEKSRRIVGLYELKFSKVLILLFCDVFATSLLACIGCSPFLVILKCRKRKAEKSEIPPQEEK
jgi:hypothetical protein